MQGNRSAPSDTAPGAFTVAGWHIDATTHRISRDGDSIKLEPRTIAVLVYLAGRAGQAVTREELEREVWAGMVVGYDALSNAITKLRKAFSDDSRHPRIIETIPKVGYRLIAEVGAPQATHRAFPTRDTGLERKLAAIVYADVASYSRLSGEDEIGTHRTLSAYLDCMTDAVQRYGGVVVHFAGDAVLAEFATVTDAVTCAVAVQRELAERNREVPKASRLEFRIGVNLGEVIVDRNDIYGDGVNIAARLEALAEPGGVCISGAVHDAVGNKLPLDYDYLGEQSVKNIAKPVRAYRARLKPGVVPPPPSQVSRPRSSRRTKALAALAAVLMVFAGGLIIWLEPWVPVEEPASVQRMVFPLPDVPSITVLPFTSLSDAPEQAYFSDGITEDLITDLSKISGLFVIAPNTSFSYKDKSVPVRQVAEELGVRYVLEGSVRRMAGQVRINAQLIDATTGRHLWADRYDGKDADIFALQDRVIGKIVAALKLSLTDEERIQLARIPTRNLEAYDYYLRADRLLYKYRGSHRVEGMSLYQRAIDLDQEFADAYAGLAESLYVVWRDSSDDILPGPVARRRAYDAASRALALDPRNARSYAVLALLQSAEGRHDDAIASVEKGILLDPSNARSYRYLANILVLAGDHERAMAAMETALRLDPKPAAQFYADLGLVLFFNRRFDEALEALEKAREMGAEPWEALITAYGQLDRPEDAQSIFEAEVLGRRPFANLSYYRALYANHRVEADLELRIGAMRRAGIPSWAYGFEPPLEERLDSTALEAVTVGRAWSGATLGGIRFFQQFTDDGQVVLRDERSLLTGKAWMEGNRLCTEFPASLILRKDCGYVYRHPAGTADEQNEYVRVALGEVYFFSVAR
ncbi:MAG: tetratricopeptide repeat protein [Gammaproteobacteria bacterium]|nr:tetratricopeptide repeat protein [Gammaproteobacteria bacterium]